MKANTQHHQMYRSSVEGEMLNIVEEKVRRKSSNCSNVSFEEDMLSEEVVEQWLDSHEEFAISYFQRKREKLMIGTLSSRRIRNASNQNNPSTPDAVSTMTNSSASGMSSIPGPLSPDDSRDIIRKISSEIGDKAQLNPVLNHVGGVPSFLMHAKRRISAPSRHRRSNEELLELKKVDEQALLIELVEHIANDLDTISLCHKILLNVCILTGGDRCSLFLVQKYTQGHKMLVSKVYDVNADSTVEEMEENEEIVVPWGTGIVGHVAQTGETVNLTDAYADGRFNRQVDVDTGYHTESLLCMPIKSAVDEQGTIEVIGVAQVLNKSKYAKGGKQFTEDDEEIFRKYLTFCGIGITNAQLFEQFQLELKRNQVLLDQARVIFEDQSTLHDVVHKIMMNTQTLIQCERCSVLLVDPNCKELFSRAFHLEARTVVSEEDGSTERKQSLGAADVSVPVTAGIIGHVATTGETLNIPNAYEDPRFDPSIDGVSGFKTKTILCMPIRNSQREIVGVCQLLNKTDGRPFNLNDENLFEAFAIFCGMVIHNTTVYEECQQARARQQIAFDVLSYHATASASDAQTMAEEPLPTSRTMKLREFYFDDALMDDKETILATLRMFTDLRFISRFRIDYKTLCSWILTVKKNYRSVTYHNWRHAFNVAQSMFLMLKEADELKNNLSDEEKFALFVGCLCHDLDHRGQNNAFQVNSSSPLAQLYGTSVMEHHHFDHCIMILHSPGNDILDSLSPEEYNMIIKEIENAILATDMAIYFKKRNTYFDLVDNKSFRWEQEDHKSLLLSMMMTACDLSAICKPWETQKRVALLVAEEFFQQGDQERQVLKRTPIEMMDRAKKDKFPVMQVGYIDFICLPLYQHVADHYNEFKPLLEYVQENKKHWKTLADEHLRKVSQIQGPKPVDAGTKDDDTGGGDAE